jgi:hypothetical protein
MNRRSTRRTLWRPVAGATALALAPTFIPLAAAQTAPPPVYLDLIPWREARGGETVISTGWVKLPEGWTTIHLPSVSWEVIRYPALPPGGQAPAPTGGVWRAEDEQGTGALPDQYTTTRWEYVQLRITVPGTRGALYRVAGGTTISFV